VATDGADVLQTKYSYSREDAEAAVIEFVENYTRLNDCFARKAEEDPDVASDAAVVSPQKSQDLSRPKSLALSPAKADSLLIDVSEVPKGAESLPKASAVTFAVADKDDRYHKTMEWMKKAQDDYSKKAMDDDDDSLYTSEYSRLKTHRNVSLAFSRTYFPPPYPLISNYLQKSRRRRLRPRGSRPPAVCASRRVTTLAPVINALQRPKPSHLMMKITKKRRFPRKRASSPLRLRRKRRRVNFAKKPARNSLTTARLTLKLFSTNSQTTTLVLSLRIFSGNSLILGNSIVFVLSPPHSHHSQHSQHHWL